MGRVFISYSHKDQDALEQLRRFLDPLERAGRLTCWDDTRIATGDDWEARIDEALGKAGAAVLLVSQDFLASDFIAKKELPWLLDKHAVGQATLLPVFISPTNVRIAHPGLTRIQGHGSPETENVLTRDERETLFKTVSERLFELAGSDPAPAPPRPAYASTPSPAPAPSSAYELTVTLQRDGAELAATYRLPGQEPFLATRRPFSAVEAAVGSIRRTLDSGDFEAVKDHIRTAPRDWGRVLFEVLFGADPGHQERLFRTAFHQQPPAAHPTAIRAPLRLRIATEDPDLLGLPWRLTTWNEHFLTRHGWVFATGGAEDYVRDCYTAAPSEVLLVGPTGAQTGLAGEETHLDVLRRTLEAIWPGQEPPVRRARTRAELRIALAGQLPHLVYVFAPLETRRGEPCLMLDGPPAKSREPIPLTHFLAALRESPRPPAIIYFNTHGPAFADPAKLLGADVPLVLWRRLPSRSGEAMDLALAWLGSGCAKGSTPWMPSIVSVPNNSSPRPPRPASSACSPPTATGGRTPQPSPRPVSAWPTCS